MAGERPPGERAPGGRPPVEVGRRAPGLGDRWLAGETLPGVRFGLHDAVRVTDGAHAGRAGRVLLLARVAPAVEYVVAVEGGEIRVPEAQLDAV